MKNDVPESQAGHNFDLMEMFAGYGFNKPHSVAYAKVAYQTAWLKHHYPADFMAAVLSADMQTTEKVVINVEECREMKITLSPPDVNEGEFRFVAKGNSDIIYGLGAIKGLGEGPIEAIVAGRQDSPYTDMYDFCHRVDARKVNKRAVEALIGSGALDNLIDERQVPDDVNPIDFKRALLLANQHDAVKTAEQKSRNEDSGLTDLFGEDMMSASNESGCPYNYIEGLRCVSFKDRLNREKDTLGLYLTGHPIDLYKKELRYFAKTRIVDLRASKDVQTVAGLIVGLRTMKSKRGETLAFVTLDDRSGRLEVSVFADLFEANHTKLQKDQLVVMKGSLSADDFSGGLKMRAAEVLDLLEARERTIKCLRLSLNETRLDAGFSEELARLLQPYKGEGCRVSIEYQRNDAVAEVSLGDAWRVSPDDQLIQNLRDRYGADQVQFDY